MVLEQWLCEPARAGRLPRWAAWYVQRWTRSRIVPSDWTEGQVHEARIAAKRICRDHGIFPGSKSHNRLTSEQLRERIEQSKPRPADVQIDDSPGERIIQSSGTIRTLTDLLDATDFDPSEWIVRSASPLAWTQGKRQAYRIKATLWPRLEALIRPAEFEATYEPVDAGPAPHTTLLIPDSQNGYRRTGRNLDRLEPLHDRLAWDLAVQVAERVQPERIVLLGDMIDNAEGSKKWPIGPELLLTLQPTIDELAWWLRRLREACPASQITYIEGNHEDRIDRALIAYMKEHALLCPAGEDVPLVSWRNYLRLDQLGIEYVGPYGVDVKLYPDADVGHGLKHGSKGGEAARKYLSDATRSYYYGHNHKRELVARTVRSGVIEAGSPGTICRVDGNIVPGSKGRRDWQQGVMLLTHAHGVTRGELVPIDAGAARFRGEVLTGVSRVEQIAAETGHASMC